MGFISFNETYYRQKLEALEGKALSGDEVYEAQQLLKVLDDLADEGYTNLNNRMENDFSCLSRLRAVIANAGASPIPVGNNRPEPASWGPEEFELNALLDKLVREAGQAGCVSAQPFLESIRQYSEWIGYDDETAYVFLLRDTLLPYVYFQSRHRGNVYPWLISRRFLEDVTRVRDVDDDLRLPVYEALESGRVKFDDFFSFCRDRILSVLDRHAELKQALLALLGSIRQETIVVVESGYAGTIPLMLKSLDSRVSFRLYTTAPFLFDTYRDILFCRRYEDIRKFETVYSQDLLLRYASFRNGKFYVNMSDSPAVKSRAEEEIRYFT